MPKPVQRKNKKLCKTRVFSFFFFPSFHFPKNIALDHLKGNYKNELLNINITKTNLDKQEVKEIKIR
ncbi:Hsp20/alpha crystallin family protein [Chryseobacterium sp. RU37D]|nr:Hsp20/alpha crystallin family protein [Chryseobacterium sp. RU37D]